MNQMDKPGWGKTIGMFFLCGMITIGICILVSASLVSQMGFSGYSNGGIMGTLGGVCCAAYYRSTGKAVPAIVASVILGAVVGALAVYLGAKAVGL